jgi:hypothetical protein
MATTGKKRKRSEGTESAGTSKTVVTLDFSQVNDGGGRAKRYKAGDYLFKVKGIKMGHSEQKQTPFCQLNLAFKDGSYAGDVISDRLYITQAALWRIRAAFTAAGTEIPKKKTKIDFRTLTGKDLWASVEDDEYEDKNGKSRIKSIVGEYLEEAPEEVEDEEDEDLEEEDDDEDEDEEDLEDMDVDEDM